MNNQENMKKTYFLLEPAVEFKFYMARNNIDMKIQAYANDGPGMYRIRTAGVQS